MESTDTHSVRPDNVRDPASLRPSGQTLEGAPWSAAHQLVFRFVFSYFFLFVTESDTVMNNFLVIFTYPHWLGDVVRYLARANEAIWYALVPWVGGHVFGLKLPITPPVYNGIVDGLLDTRYNYVRLFCIVVIAVVATIVWSAIDSKRITYFKLDQWTRVFVRVILAYEMFSYGGIKVIPSQMPPPSLSTLLTPFGDIAPGRLLWNFMGSSTGYETFAGCVEVMGGILLLIPGMSTLGAAVSLGALANVLVMNAGYGVFVVFWPFALMLFAAFLLLPDVPRIMNLVVLNRRTEPEPRQPLFRRRWLNYSVWGLQWVVGACALAGSLALGSGIREHASSIRQTSPLYGIWRVEEFTADGQVRSPLLTDDLRWQRIVFDAELTVNFKMVATIQDMDGELSPYVATIDTNNNAVSLRTPRPNECLSWMNIIPHSRSGTADLKFNRTQPDAMVLEGMMNGHQVRVTLKREDPRFILRTRGFHWVNEYEDEVYPQNL
jgi:hypothetical protein